jgi:hypothetical protein
VFWAGRRWCAIDMGWADGLVSADPVVRRAARERFGAEEAARHARQRVVNGIWAAAGSLDPQEPRQAARMVAARAEQERLDGRSMLRTLWDGWWTDEVEPEAVHLSLRYLEWEAWYPREWHRHWGTKAGLLANLARTPGRSAADRRRLEDLVLAAVGRDHRCEDRRYVPLARAIAGDGLRARLAARAGERAAYLLYHLDHPDLAATAASWRRWLAAAQPSPR